MIDLSNGDANVVGPPAKDSAQLSSTFVKSSLSARSLACSGPDESGVAADDKLTMNQTGRKQDWWDLRVNLRSMSEYEAMRQRQGSPKLDV